MYQPIQLTTTIPSIRNSLNRSPLRRGLPRKQQLPRTQAMWIIRGFLLIALALAWFALSPTTRAADGDLGNGNTAEGAGALVSLATGGADNTAMGINALFNNTTGINNTASGAFALSSNTTGHENTANGLEALTSNTTGFQNTATGVEALLSNTTGSGNTANGFAALNFNTTGFENTANGAGALLSNTTGSGNTANGDSALASNTTGFDNTANGAGALLSNTTGNNNTADGVNALFNNTTGKSNIALGVSAGINLTTGKNNIDVGNAGVAGEAAKIRIGTAGTHKNTFIAGISGVTVAGGVGVIIDANGHLGTVTSSERFKDEIKPMDKTSEAILALQPVTFHYKHELDPDGIPQFGLVAEQVEKVNRDLVDRDDQGKAYTVRYEVVNTMLLNEFLKEHRKVEQQQATITEVKATVAKEEATIAQVTSTAAKQEATIAKQQKEIEALTTGLKKVSDEIEVSKVAPQLVVSNQ